MRKALIVGDEKALDLFSKSTGFSSTDEAFVKSMVVALGQIEGLLLTWSRDLSLVRWTSSTAFYGLAVLGDPKTPTYLGNGFWSAGAESRLTLTHESAHYFNFSHKSYVGSQSGIALSRQAQSDPSVRIQAFQNNYVLTNFLSGKTP